MTEDQPWTVLRLLNWTREYLAKVHLEEARLAAEVLLAHVLKCKRIELYTRFDYVPAPDQLAQFRDLVKRAAAFEPVAYMVGFKEFYSLPLKVTKDVLVPRPETEMLAMEAIAHLKKLGRPGTIWDVCTGSGCVAIAVAVNVPDSTVLATDISTAAVEVAKENAATNKVDSRCRLRVADLLTLPADCTDLAPFDVITGNPPYVAGNQLVSEVVKHEPPIAVFGGTEGLDLLAPIIANAAPLIRPAGALMLEFGFGMADAVRDLVVATGQFQEPRILRDHQDIERSLVTVRKPT
jgi:release factor glutamine methyltransferase